jgi:hypothetical protein
MTLLKRIVLALLAVALAGLPASALWDLLVNHIAWRGGIRSSYQVTVFPKRHPIKFWAEAAGYVAMICAILVFAYVIAIRRR